MTLKLTPQKQRCKHDPENGIHGDCYRTAVAVALGLPAEVVPHVYAGEGQEGGGGLDAMRAWLAARGLGLFEAHLNPAETLESVLALSARAPGVPTIVSGFSPRGFNHSIVALDGAAKGDAGDAFWWIEVLVVTPAQRAPARETFEMEAAMGDVTLPNRLRLHIPIVTEEHRQSAHGVMREAADHIEALEADNARLRGLFQSDGKTTFRTDKMTRGQAHDAVRAAQEDNA